MSKFNPVIIACGSIDELSAFIGLILSYKTSRFHQSLLKNMQRNLYEIMASLSGSKKENLHDTLENEVKKFEKEIDDLTAMLPPLSRFILPGGTKTSALLHIARTVCRRAERNVVVCKPNNSMILPYINRLSDLLFVLARKYSAQEKTL